MMAKDTFALVVVLLPCFVVFATCMALAVRDSQRHDHGRAANFWMAGTLVGGIGAVIANAILHWK